MSVRTSVPPDVGKLPITPQVSQPPQQKIIEDIRDCIKELKSDFEDSNIPIDDDNQTLHRFCAKFEYLLQASMKERLSLLGRKKDYWDYFQESLRSTKGASDGIKYVKTLSEYKTSLGKGRALLRFCLMHSRMADTVQQCIVNGKVTSDWYLPNSLWLQHDLSGLLIEALYDLSDVQFDLVPRGYDLDNAWPSFAKKMGGAYNWNPPSRASSISSLASIPGLVSDGAHRFSCTPTPGETSHLPEPLHNDTDLLDRIDALEHQKFSFQQSLAESHGELEAIQNQHTALNTQHAELDKTCRELEKKINKSNIALEKRESEWKIKEAEHQRQLDISNQDSDKLKSQLSELDRIIASTKKTKEKGQKKISELDSSMSEILLQNKSLTHELDISQQSDMKKSECIDGLENKISVLEVKNSEIMGKFESVLMEKSDKATDKLDTANTLHDVVGKLRETEELKLQYQLNIVELKRQCSVLEEDMESVRNELHDSNVKYKEELSSLEKCIGEQKQERSESETQFMKERELILTKLENCEKDVGKKEDKLLEMQSELEQLQNKHHEKEQIDIKFLEDMSKLTSDLETTKLKSQKCEIEMKEELDKVSCEKTDLISQNSTLELELDSLKLSGDSSNNIIESLKEECQKLTKHAEELSVNNSQLQNELVHLNNQLKDTVEQQSLDNSSSEEIKMTLHDKMATIRTLELEQQNVKQAVKWLYDNRQRKNSVVIALNVQDKDTTDVLNGLSNHLGTVNSNMAEAVDGSKRQCAELEAFHQEQIHLKKEIDSYKDRISRLDSQINEINDWANKLESYRAEIEEQLKMEKTRNSCLTEDLNTKDIEIRQSSEAFDNVKSENIKLSEELNASSKEIMLLNDCMQKSKVDIQMLVQSENHSAQNHSSLSEQLQTKSKLIEDKVKLISHLEENDKIAKDKLGSLTEERNKLAADNELLKDKYANLFAHNAEVEKKLADNNDEKTNLAEVNEGLLEKIKKLERDIGILKLEKESDKSRSKEALNACQLDRDKMYHHVEEALVDTKSIKEQLKYTSVQLEAVCGEKDQLEKECNSLLVEKNELESEVEKAKTHIESLENDLRSLRNIVDSSEIKIVDLDKEKNEFLNEIEDLKKAADDFGAIKSEELIDKDVEIGRLEKRVSELTDNLEMLEKEKKVEDDSLLSLSGELQIMTRERDQLKNELLSLGIEVTEKAEAIGKLNHSSSHLQDTIGELEKSLAEKMEGMSRLESHKEDLTRDYSMQIELLQQEILALQFQFSTEQLQHEEAFKMHASQESSVSNLKEELVTQEAVIEQLESNLGQLKLEQERERNEKQLESQNLTTKVHEFAREAEMWRSMSEKQQLELEDEKKNGENRIQEKTEELALLQNDMSQIKKKVIKLLKEKDTLWQKTDSMAYQQKLQANEKWVKSTTVTDCLHCKAEFSFMLRKHHCRLCGKIFCSNCSNNWIMTPHSKKQCRVCNLCHQRHGSQNDGTDSQFFGANSDSDDDEQKQMRRKLPFDDTDSSTSSVSPIDAEPTSTSGDADSDQSVEAPLSSIPGHVISNLTISLVSDNETEEVKRRKTKAGDERKEGGAEESTEETDVFHLISDDEIAKSRNGSELQQPIYSDPNMSCSLLLSADDLEKDQINHTNEVLLKAGKSHAVPIHIGKKDTLLCWQFTSHPKDVMFSITHTNCKKDVQTLIPSCKCESHKQTVKGEMTAMQPGIYTLIFDNTYSRLTSKKVVYSLWAKTDM